MRVFLHGDGAILHPDCDGSLNLCMWPDFTETHRCTQTQVHTNKCFNSIVPMLTPWSWQCTILCKTLLLEKTIVQELSVLFFQLLSFKLSQNKEINIFFKLDAKRKRERNTANFPFLLLQMAAVRLHPRMNC